MTRFSDNIYTGFQALTSATSSKSGCAYGKTYNFSGTVGSTTLKGVFPPNTQNLTARLYVVQQGASATTSDKITVSAGGTDLVTITGFGSATGTSNDTKASFATFTYVASACASVPAPATNQTNGGEIPFAVTYVASSANKTGACQLKLEFTRADTNTLGVTS